VGAFHLAMIAGAVICLAAAASALILITGARGAEGEN
jgi:hypothetical protein